MNLTLLLVFSLFFSFSSANTELNFHEFYQMVIDNISAAYSYVLPTDNRKHVYVEDNKQIIDFGKFDFIIVGAGSAGTLLANRLSEIKQWNILLLEAGGDENDFSGIPGMAPVLEKTDMNWGYYSTPQNSCCLGMRDKKCVAPRGKVLGGTGVINAKMYVRGNRNDFDMWETLGNRGWSYKDVLPYFIKTENSSIHNGDIGYHNTNGLLHIQTNEPTIFTEAYLDSMKEMKVPIVDYNGKTQLGASPIAYTINGLYTASGRRAFIDPIRKRKNLNITLNAFVTKVLVDHNKKVTGVEFINEDKIYHASSSKETILSAGSFNSPQILLLSGIGPTSELAKHQITVVHELPVGQYLQEHPGFFCFIVRTNHSLFNDSLVVWLKKYLQGQRPLTNPMNSDSLRFLKTSPHSLYYDLPDIQHILVTPPGFQNQFGPTFNYVDSISESLKNNYNPYTDVVIATSLLHPKSYGEVTLKSSNPKDFPNIDYKLFSDPDNLDIETMYQGIMEAFKILDTQAFRALNATYIPFEGGCGGFQKTCRKYWHCMLRRTASVFYHPVGTTKMGTNPVNSVVNPNLNVHGIKNLRVVDAGSIPYLTSGNINAVVYMIAERAADIIKKYYKV